MTGDEKGASPGHKRKRFPNKPTDQADKSRKTDNRNNDVIYPDHKHFQLPCPGLGLQRLRLSSGRILTEKENVCVGVLPCEFKLPPQFKKPLAAAFLFHQRPLMQYLDLPLSSCTTPGVAWWLRRARMTTAIATIASGTGKTINVQRKVSPRHPALISPVVHRWQPAFWLSTHPARRKYG